LNNILEKKYEKLIFWKYSSSWI